MSSVLNASLCAQRFRTSRSSKTRLRSERVSRLRNEESHASAITFNKNAGSRSEPGAELGGPDSRKLSSQPSPCTERIWWSMKGPRPSASASKARPTRSRLLTAICLLFLQGAVRECGDLPSELDGSGGVVNGGLVEVLGIAAFDRPAGELFEVHLEQQAGSLFREHAGEAQQVVGLRGVHVGSDEQGFDGLLCCLLRQPAGHSRCDLGIRRAVP